MPPGGSVESRRRFTQAILDTVVTGQSVRGGGVSEEKVLDELVLKQEFTDEFAREQLRTLDNYPPCPLECVEDGERRVYTVERSQSIPDFILGLEEDGRDPANL